jgi:hypothetical protein
MLAAGAAPPQGAVRPPAAASAAAAPSPAAVLPEPPPAPRDGSIVHVQIETVIVDRGGTRSGGTDEADLVPGAEGVLTKEITLTGRDRRRTRETIVLEARLIPEAGPPAGLACALRVRTRTLRRAAEARPAAARDTPVDSREIQVALGAEEERVVEAYSSSMTGGRVALRLGCAQARSDDDGIPDLVTLDLQVEKSAPEEVTELLRSQRLVAAIGREASTVIVANQGLPDEPEGGKRYRRERLEAVLTPLVLVAGKLQVDVRLAGDITTVSSNGAQALVPFEHIETCVLAAGERRAFDIVVDAGAADAGWTRLTLTVEVIARF